MLGVGVATGVAVAVARTTLTTADRRWRRTGDYGADEMRREETQSKVYCTVQTVRAGARRNEDRKIGDSTVAWMCQTLVKSPSMHLLMADLSVCDSCAIPKCIKKHLTLSFSMSTRH